MPFYNLDGTPSDSPALMRKVAKLKKVVEEQQREASYGQAVAETTNSKRLQPLMTTITAAAEKTVDKLNHIFNPETNPDGSLKNPENLSTKLANIEKATDFTAQYHNSKAMQPTGPPTDISGSGLPLSISFISNRFDFPPI